MSLDGSEPPGAARTGDGMSGVCTVRHGGNAGKNTFLQLFRPQYATAFVQPGKETVKVRNEVRVARLQFRQDSYNIDPKFKNNESELATVSSSVEVVKTNPDLTITGIYITGYASPRVRWSIT